jgi:hypothetical protein
LISTLHQQAGAQFWDNPYTYNFCSIEGATSSAAGTGRLSEQASMLRHGTTQQQIQDADPTSTGASSSSSTVPPGHHASSAVAFASTGPLGEQQMWCNGPQVGASV